MTNFYQLELLIHTVCSLSAWLFNSIDPVVVVVLMMVVEGEEEGVKLINKSVDQQLNSLLGAKKRLDIRNLASLFNYQMFCLSINIPSNSLTRTLVGQGRRN